MDGSRVPSSTPPAGTFQAFWPSLSCLHSNRALGCQGERRPRTMGGGSDLACSQEMQCFINQRETRSPQCSQPTVMQVGCLLAVVRSEFAAVAVSPTCFSQSHSALLWVCIYLPVYLSPLYPARGATLCLSHLTLTP